MQIVSFLMRRHIFVVALGVGSTSVVNSLIADNAKGASKYLKKLTKKMKDNNASILHTFKKKEI